MPVPVPWHTTAHPVVKSSYHSGDLPQSRLSIFDNLTHSLPLPPAGPPPSYGTREEWISSLPSWRRNKTRRIWEEDESQHHTGREFRDFHFGLTDAGNALVIKG